MTLELEFTYHTEAHFKLWLFDIWLSDGGNGSKRKETEIGIEW